MTAFDWLSKYLVVAGAANVGNNWQCPSHEDSYPSLTLASSIDGTVLMFCHAGCTYDQVMASLGLSTKLLFEAHCLEPKRTYELNLIKPKFKPIQYRSGSGSKKYRESFFITHHGYTPEVRLERIKYQGGEKICRWQVKEGGKWIYSNGKSLNLKDLPLYNETEVIRGGYVDEVIVLCESESSVDALFNKGIFATTWAGGASSVKTERLKKVLNGQKVLWIPDNDLAGLKCSKLIEEEVRPLTARWVNYMGEPDEDARDLLMRGAISLEIVEDLFR
jgi:hypothetical protein